MKFYDFDVFAPNPWVVWIFALEKGIALDRVSVDLFTRENRQQPFLSDVNPMGELPAIQDSDGWSLSEVVPICEYLEDLHPEPPLIGRTPRDRAETRMWVRRIDQNIAWPMGEGFTLDEGRSFFEADFDKSEVQVRKALMPGTAAASLKDKARSKTISFDRLLSGGEWVCGSRFSLADIFLYCFLQFGENHGQPIPADAPWMRDFFARMKSRPTAWSGEPGSLD